MASIDFDEIYLTSQQILERISEQTIYEYYLNESIKDKLVKCCFHKDTNPSMGFYISSSGSLNYKCFGCGAQGNVFSFVSKLNNDSNFGKTLSIIQNTFKLSKNGSSTNGLRIYEAKQRSLDEKSQEISKTQIIPTFRNFNKVDFDYWNRYYIPLDLLVKYDIKACARVYIVKKSGEYILFAEHSKDNPIYCYQIDDQFKIYRPYSDKKGKWAGNTDNYAIQGLKQLPDKGELLIITSSMKDVLVLNILGYNAIALGGEGNRIPDKILDYLWACFDNIVVFYDNDKAGLEYGVKLSEEIGAGNIHIPVKYKEKDISDFVDQYDLEAGDKLMKELL